MRGETHRRLKRKKKGTEEKKENSPKEFPNSLKRMTGMGLLWGGGFSKKSKGGG